MIFNRLLVIDEAPNSKPVPSNKYGFSRWNCVCACGTKLAVDTAKLRNGNTPSCGCITRERCTTHGMHLTSEYNSWTAAKTRCNNKNSTAYSYYGGRGITFFPKWEKDFQAFFNYMGKKPSKKHSLDRIDPNGNYEPGNLRWATQSEQARNTRCDRCDTRAKFNTQTIVGRQLSFGLFSGE